MRDGENIDRQKPSAAVVWYDYQRRFLLRCQNKIVASYFLPFYFLYFPPLFFSSFWHLILLLIYVYYWLMGVPKIFVKSH